MIYYLLSRGELYDAKREKKKETQDGYPQAQEAFEEEQA